MNPNGTVYVPLVLDTTAALPGDAATIGPAFVPNEFPLDPAGGAAPTAAADGVPWASVRLAANLRQQYRVLGNPYIRSATIRFANLALSWLATTDGIQTSHDLLELGWTGSTPVVRTGSLALPNGNWGAPVYLGVVASGANSLTAPGMTFRVVTGPDIGEGTPPTALDRESWGFEAERMEVSGTSLGSTTVPTLGLYDNIIAVLLPTNDTVRMIAPTTGHPVSILMWAPSTNATFQSGPVLWARCGAPPTATQFDAVQFLVSPGRAIIQRPPCPSGQSLNIAVTNTGSTARAVRLFIGSNRAEREYNINVGFSFNATQTQLSAVREQFRRAAWLFFGMTGGSHVIRSYRFYNNSWCDAFPDTACDGGSCDVCVEASGNSDCVSTVTVPVSASYRTIAHEFGHCLTRISSFDGLRDEYRDDACPSDRPTCPHTLMAGAPIVASWNARNLCTDQTHFRTGVNWDIYAEARSQSDDNVSCGAVWRAYPFYFPLTSGWTWLNGRTVASFPAGQSAHVLPFEHFWSSTVLGRFDKLE